MSSRPGKTTVVYFLTQVGSTVIGFAATWYIINALGGDIYGQYAKVRALLFWLVIPASAVGYAMNKRISENRDQSSFLGAGLVVNLGLNAALVVALVLASPLVDSYVGEPVSLAVAALVAARAGFDTVLSALRGFKQVGWSGVVKTTETVFRASSQIAAIALVGIGLLGLVVSHAFALVIAAGIGVAVLGGRPSPPSRGHYREIASFARYSWIGTAKTRAFAFADVLVMGSLAAAGLVAVSDTQIGIYNAAWTVASVLALVSTSIKQTLFPELSELSAEDRYERVQHFLNEGLVFTGVFAIPGLFGAVIVGSTLMTIFEAEFARGGTILVILIGARLLAAYAEQFINVVNAVDRPDVAFRINLAYVVANLSLNVGLVLLFGWYGAAVATVTSAGVALVYGGYTLGRIVGRPDVPWREIGFQVASSVAMLAVIAALRDPLPETLAWTLLLVAVGAAVYGLALVGLSARVRQKVRGLLPGSLAGAGG